MDGHLEIERSFELELSVELPDLSGTAGVRAVRRLDEESLDATYYDSADLRLVRAGSTLRRRTGGRDAGWHLKLPVGADTREEVHRPARGRATAVPRELTDLLRSRLRGQPLQPVARLRTTRQVIQLLDADQRVLAEVADDAVSGEVLAAPVQTAVWREVEVELVDGDRALLDAVSTVLQGVGALPASRPSKLARTLGDRLPAPAPRATTGRPTAGTAVLAHLDEQITELLARDPGVRRDLPDSVHKMRVATRRLRSALKTFRPLLDRERTDPVRGELAHLAGVLGRARDAEVLRDRLRSAVAALPAELVLGPVLRRVDDELGGQYRRAHAGVVAALDSDRHLALLDALDRLLTDPPLRERAARPARTELRRLVRHSWYRLEGAVAAADDAGSPAQRDELLHEVRKAAKQVRYAAEATAGVLGRDASRLAARAEAVQEVLGEHQDSVVTRAALRELAVTAQQVDESAFTFGLLHGREGAQGDRTPERFAAAWAKTCRPKVVRWLR